ncbi:MAG: hypothetical protein NT157_02875, partial [Candidatus Micrarchaeota archaeon]|nr:hypothetical protein [Candidatus Micrarchaeota archaeon]
MRLFAVVFAFILISPLLLAVNMEPCKDCYYTDILLSEERFSDRSFLIAELSYYGINFTYTQIENVEGRQGNVQVDPDRAPVTDMGQLNDKTVGFLYYREAVDAVGNPILDADGNPVLELANITGCDEVLTRDRTLDLGAQGIAQCDITALVAADSRACIPIVVKFEGYTDELDPDAMSYLPSEASYTACDYQMPILSSLGGAAGNCFPLFIILGLLIAAMYSAGLDPLAAFDVSTPRTPRPKRKPMQAPVMFMTWSYTRIANLRAFKAAKNLAKNSRRAVEDLLKDPAAFAKYQDMLSKPKDQEKLSKTGLTRAKLLYLQRAMKDTRYQKLSDDEKLFLFGAVLADKAGQYVQVGDKILNRSLSNGEVTVLSSAVEKHFMAFTSSIKDIIADLRKDIKKCDGDISAIAKRLSSERNETQKNALRGAEKKRIAKRDAYLKQLRFLDGLVGVDDSRRGYAYTKANYDMTLVASGLGTKGRLNKVVRMVSLAVPAPLIAPIMIGLEPFISSVSEISVKSKLVGRGLVGAALAPFAAIKYAKVKAKGPVTEEALTTGKGSWFFKHFNLNIGKVENVLENGCVPIMDMAAALARKKEKRIKEINAKIKEISAKKTITKDERDQLERLRQELERLPQELERLKHEHEQLTPLVREADGRMKDGRTDAQAAGDFAWLKATSERLAGPANLETKRE